MDRMPPPPAPRTPGAPAPDDRVFQDFQRELELLEAFRDQYRSLYGFAGLERDDPDVQRMIEALAFFSARTRGEAERALARHESRALEQLFPYLLSPLPAMGLLSVEGTRGLADARTLPAGTEIAVAPPPASGGGAREELSFRTLRPVHVRPFEVDPASVELLRLGDEGWELRLVVRAEAPQQEPLDHLQFQIAPQGDLVAALRLHQALRRSLKQISYTFLGTRDLERTTRRASFAAPPNAREVDPYANPLEGFRRFLHFPLAALGLRVPLEAAPREWTGVRLRLHLSSDWPAGLGVSPKAFLLHATPIVNLRRELAAPIPHDGTGSRAEVAHPDPTRGFRPRDLVGVYRSAPGGLVPVLPSSVGGEGESYAAEAVGRQLERQMWLDLDLPGATERPTSVVPDVEWYQPAAGRLFEGELLATPVSRHLERVRWQLHRPLQGAADSPLVDRRDRLARLLDMSARVELDAPGLAYLVDVLGAAGHELFSRVTRSIAGFSSEVGPDARSPSGQRRAFVVQLKRLPPTLRPAADLLFAQVPSLLATWYGVPAASLRVHVEGDEQDVEYRHGTEEGDLGQ